MHITDQQIATYKRQGFVIIENFLTEEERQATLSGFFRLYAPPYEQWLAEGRTNNTPRQEIFPWDDSGLNHAAAHPHLIDAAERITGTRDICLSQGVLGMKYAGEKPLAEEELSALSFHVDYSNNTLGPEQNPDDFMHSTFFYCFDEVKPGMAPIFIVPNGRPEAEAVPMIVPGGSLCIYSIFTRHSASPFTAPAGHRPVMWFTLTRKDRPWDGARWVGDRGTVAMQRFLAEASPRQRELLGFPPPGDPLWSRTFIQGMAKRYPGFDPAPYLKARAIE